MFNSVIFLSICWDCTLEVLPMLTVAWLLGCLFLWIFSGTQLKKEKKKLKTELKIWKEKANVHEKELNSLNFDWETTNTELKSLQNNYKELEIRYKALEVFKGASANIVYEPVPPPHSLVKEMEAEDQKKKRVVYFSSDKNKKETPSKAGHNKIVKKKKGLKIELGYNNAFTPSDLTIVEGIGEKLSQLLKENGISTWTRLAVTSVADLRQILEKAAGPKFKMHDPSSWPQQASLARVGQWEELILLQKGLSPANKSKVKKLYKKSKGAAAYRIDDLKIIEGIGPKIEQLLKDGGIDNWEKLASATVADITQILKAAGDRYRLADPSTWVKQAKLAHEGEWEELKDYQGRLKGGKEV
ncbi:MAG: helix-hairpin-helix domain-containing protein [Saprospiraceae bacterium]